MYFETMVLYFNERHEGFNGNLVERIKRTVFNVR